MNRAILICLMLIAILSGCTKDQANNSACQTCSVISFRTDIIPIFQANCSMSGCHTGAPASAAGHVSLDSAVAYAQATYPGKGYVTAYNANNSILYSQLLPNFPNHMPNNGKQLDDCTIKKIYCWINQGALNN